MTTRTGEWLEADGLGGFASHTTDYRRTRRYHALLLVSRRPPTDRRVLVNGLEATVDVQGQRWALTSQTYRGARESDPPVISREGLEPATSFDNSVWPSWTHDLGEGATVEHCVLVPRDQPLVILSWRLRTTVEGPVTLKVKPFLSGRDYHSLHRENADFNFDPEENAAAGRYVFHPYPEEPPVMAATNGTFVAKPLWYSNFLYTEDQDRGLDCVEDLAAPGTFSFDLAKGEALLVLGTLGAMGGLDNANLRATVAAIRESEERARREAKTPMDRAAGSFIARRGEGRTILAGYPWFTDWGRDTFIALRGLCLATGRLREARRILLEWSTSVSHGMLPNRFTDSGEIPDFNSVDASLWFIVAVHDLRDAEARAGFVPSTVDEWQLNAAIVSILRGYASGTRHQIHMETDFLLAAGAPGVQLTWMDAKVGDHVVTPRTGKPVEIQALWINALRIGGVIDPRFAGWADEAETSFNRRFWNDDAGYLYDVIDTDHVAGRVDARIRPNALFAVGGLPFEVTRGSRARAIVDLAEEKLLTPVGLRTLSSDDPQYRGIYHGGVWARDTAYHQGTAWPYLMGAFVEAWVRTRGRSDDGMREARERFLAPMLETLDPGLSGHLPEITDGDAPHTPRGCPFQAWSLGEALRLDRLVLARR